MLFPPVVAQTVSVFFFNKQNLNNSVEFCLSTNVHNNILVLKENFTLNDAVALMKKGHKENAWKRNLLV